MSKFDKIYESMLNEAKDTVDVKGLVEVEIISDNRSSPYEDQWGLAHYKFDVDWPEDGEEKIYKEKLNGWTFTFTLATDYYTMPGDSGDWMATKGKMKVAMKGIVNRNQYETMFATSIEDYEKFKSDMKIKDIFGILSQYNWADV